MSCQQDVGILDENGKLTNEAKNSFISQVLLVLEYGTENIPAEKKPPIPFPEVLPPDPTFKDLIEKDENYLKDEKIYSAFHKNWLGRYEKLAKDLNLTPNFSLLPAVADPIAIAGSGFNVEIPTPSFPGGFTPYFAGQLPQKLIGDLVSSGDDSTKAKFLSPTGPVELIKSLIEKKAPPSPPPPAPPIVLPPPPPPGFSLPSQDPNQKLIVNLTPEQIAANSPKPPEAVLSDLSAKEFSAFENLPKVLTEVIGKIPSLITKLADPGKVVGDIGKIVKNSGMAGPQPKETSYLEKAAQAVLSAKIAEMTFVGALSITVGSAPGSATTAITQKTSSAEPQNKYKPKKRKEPPKQKEFLPSEKAYQRAIGLNGSSYGDISQRTRYLEGLFYSEVFFRDFPKDYLNVYGEPIVQRDGSTGPLRLDKEKSKNIEGISDYRPLEDLDSIPANNLNGFFELCELSAGNLSSCGMFVRSCYQAAGALNFFFLSLYAHGTAVQVIQNIGLMRNYRWVSEDSENYDPVKPPDGKRAIINDLYELIKGDDGVLTAKLRNLKDSLGYSFDNENMTVERFKALLEKYAGEKSIYNTNYNELKNQKKSDPYGVVTVQFGGDWSLEVDKNGKAKPQKNLSFLAPYLKDREERAYLYGKDIGAMLYNPNSPTSGFPSLKKGDAMLIVKTKPIAGGTDWLTNGEHVLLVSEDREAGYKHNSLSNNQPPKLAKSIFGIEGGSLDDNNLKPSSKPYTFTNKESVKALLQAATAPSGDAKKFVLLQGGISQAEADQAFAAFEGNGAAPSKLAAAISIGNLKLEGTLEVPSPSAILSTEHDLGYVNTTNQSVTPDNRSGPGFFIGATIMARTNNLKYKADVNNSVSIGSHPSERRIIGIFKTDNFCNKAENDSPLASIAASYMDKTIVNDTLTTYIKNPGVLDRIGHVTFPGMFKPPPKPVKIAAGNSQAESKPGKLAIDTPQQPINPK